VGAAAVAASIATPRLVGRAQAQTRTLKISHQFPGGSIDQGDFRDRLCQIFAREVEKRTGGSLKFEIHANSSLMKTVAQFSAMRKGGLDFSLYPLAYAGGEVHAVNLGLMPCMVPSYDHAARWKGAPVGRALDKIVEDKGVKIISWIWQAGGIASRSKPILVPDDVKGGVKIRGGSREMDLMLAAAGGQISTAPSNEIYIGMQTGALEAAVTSSTSLISFRLEELSKAVTTGRNRSFWFMLEPLCMSRDIFNSLTTEQQKVVLDVAVEMEAFGTTEAKKDDEQVAKVYGAKGAQVADLTEEQLAAWRKVAEASSWKDYAAKSTEAAELMKLAQTMA
jgi:TRAP-type C4-dicarboxylate transport system substrate-binding protein